MVSLVIPLVAHKTLLLLYLLLLLLLLLLLNCLLVLYEEVLRVLLLHEHGLLRGHLLMLELLLHHSQPSQLFVLHGVLPAKFLALPGVDFPHGFHFGVRGASGLTSASGCRRA